MKVVPKGELGESRNLKDDSQNQMLQSFDNRFTTPRDESQQIL